MKISLPSPQVYAERGVSIPDYLRRTPKFKFDPTQFCLDHPQLEEKIYTAQGQIDSLESFINNPFSPVIYGVASAPDDTNAKFFAAYLVYMFLKNTSNLNSVIWTTTSTVRTEGKVLLKDCLLKSPSLLVITGLNPNTPQYKLDMVHEVCDHHSSIPRIVVVSGEDPVTFFYTKLFLPLNLMYFKSASIVKRKTQII